MDLLITERQLKLLLSKEITEQPSEAPETPTGPDTTTGPAPDSTAPESGTSDTQSGGSGYPNVDKWESGATRGPGNQISVTKWSDVVGSSLTRGKANPLE